MRPVAGLVLLALAGWLHAGASAAGGEAPATMRVEGTSFMVAMPDGRGLASPDLVGAVLEAADEAGRMLTIRIDAVVHDPADPHGDIWLHSLATRNAGTGEWTGFCDAAPDGTVSGFPLAGRWTPDGRHLRDPAAFTITCTSGAIGKCVRLGYRPWAEAAGRSLWDYHQACVRMMRAHYGGDGTARTRNGTLIDVIDRLGIQQPDPNSKTLSFEAAWGPDGAICVRRTRIPGLFSSGQLAERYPRLGRNQDALDCSEATPAYLWNRS